MSREKLTFHGGIHPRGAKSLSKKVAIQQFLPQGNMIYPLSQHIGAPAVPVVEAGDYVLAGQGICLGSDLCVCLREDQGSGEPSDPNRGRYYGH